MRLTDCDLEGVDVIVAAPYRRSQPETRWQAAYESGRIPQSLYRFYVAADFCSVERAPSFLDDSGGYLWVYLEQLLNGLREALQETSKLVEEIQESTTQVIDDFRNRRDPSTSSANQNRAFRQLLTDLVSALDLHAELTALLLTSQIPGLRLGRAAFRKIYEQAAGETGRQEGITSVTQDYSHQYLDRIRPLVIREPPEQEWLELLWLYRNKLAHLTTAVLTMFTFTDSDGNPYSFTPRCWPFLFMKRQIARGSRGREDDEPEVTLPEVMQRELVGTDIVEYSEKTTRKVHEVVEVGCGVLLEAYSAIKGWGFNEEALEQLLDSSGAPRFQYYE